MRRTKIGIMFLVFVLALAGIGITYAGFTDTIYVYGTVDTGTVEFEIVKYSGTDVWKVWGPDIPTDDEIYIYRGFEDNRPTANDVLAMYPAGTQVLLVASSWAQDGTAHKGKDYDVDMVWDNIFPCIDFTADVLIHYIGSVPAKVDFPIIEWHQGRSLFYDYVTIKAFSYIKETDGTYTKDFEITTWPYQVHECYNIGFEVTIHIPQNNDFQDKHGEFSFNIKAIQWNDQCEQTTDDKDVVIPETGNIKVRGPFPSGWPAYLKTTVSNTGEEGWTNGAGTPYNLWNGDWLGWCVDEDHLIYPGTTYDVEFYSSYDPNMPDPCKDPDWPYANWIINNKGDATPQQIQAALWYFVDGGWAPYGDPTHSDYDQTIQDLIDGAYNNPEGDNYKPDAGQWIAVICWIDNSHQITFIEVDP